LPTQRLSMDQVGNDLLDHVERHLLAT